MSGETAITIRISEEMADFLAFEAGEWDMSVEEYVLKVVMERRFALPAHKIPRNGAELVDYWERAGLIGYRPDITDSVEYARALRREAERRDPV
jgi:hypothetical protein